MSCMSTPVCGASACQFCGVIKFINDIFLQFPLASRPGVPYLHGSFRAGGPHDRHDNNAHRAAARAAPAGRARTRRVPATHTHTGRHIQRSAFRSRPREGVCDWSSWCPCGSLTAPNAPRLGRQPSPAAARLARFRRRYNIHMAGLQRSRSRAAPSSDFRSLARRNASTGLSRHSFHGFASSLTRALVSPSSAACHRRHPRPRHMPPRHHRSSAIRVLRDQMPPCRAALSGTGSSAPTARLRAAIERQLSPSVLAPASLRPCVRAASSAQSRIRQERRG